MTIYQLQVDFHDRVLDGRAMDLTIQSDLFQQLYESSDPKQLEKITDVLLRMSKFDLKQWVDEHPDLPIEEWSIRRMHNYGSQHGIYNYSRLAKVDLCREIREIKEKQNEKS